MFSSRFDPSVQYIFISTMVIVFCIFEYTNYEDNTCILEVILPITKFCQNQCSV